MSARELNSISFPFRYGEGMFPVPAKGIDAVLASVRSLILTGRGERVMRPRIGLGANRYVFESVSPLLRARIIHELHSAITAHEPRANVLNITVEMGEQVGSLLVTILLTVKGVSDSNPYSVVETLGGG